MKQKIYIKENFPFENLIQEVEQGGRFIVFSYCISIVAMSFRCFSPAIFVRNGESIKGYQVRYNLWSFLFGWWGIPWGPVYTIKYIVNNNKGGIDVTEDVVLNIDEKGFYEREYELVKTNQYFCKPDNWDKREFIKALSKVYERDYNLHTIIIGNYINTGEEEPYYTIGIECEKDYQKYPLLLKEALNSRFKARTYFRFLDLKEEKELGGFLQKQGEIVLRR